jgi:hypothetical protein
MSETGRPIFSYWLWAGLLLTAGKLWLTRGQPVYAIGPAVHDDRLFLQLADSLIHGEWLGRYTQMTLAKGPFYSMWIAALYWIGIPLGLGVQLAYAGACALLARACRPALRSGAVLFALYSFLLWNPMSFEAPTLGRVIRQQIYTPLELAVLAGLVALFCRRQDNLRCQLPWALLLGLAFGCFWLTREEGVWLVPSVLLLTGAALFWAFRLSAAQGRTMARSLGLALVFGVLPLILVSWQNHRHYGWFGTVEFRAPEFADAYGAMVRVKIGPRLPFVPVTRQAREAMYAVSPTFAKLQPFLEGDYGRGWAAASQAVTKLPPEERQIGSGWLMWALRDTVAAAGFCSNARDALDFYRHMADEINQACDDGRLPAGPRRSGFLPVWQEGQTAELARTFFQFFDFVVSYKSFNAFTRLSIGDNDDVQLFRDVTRDRLSPSERATNIPLPNQDALNITKISLLQSIGNLLRPVLLVLFIVTGVVGLVRATQAIMTRRLTYPLVLALAAFGGFVAYLLINALVHITSFSVIAVSTFWPLYPLSQVFMVAVIWDAAVAWFGRVPAAAPADRA